MSALVVLRGFAPNRVAALDFAPNPERLKSTRDAAANGNGLSIRVRVPKAEFRIVRSRLRRLEFATVNNLGIAPVNRLRLVRAIAQRRLG
jgi:hypothetical protein